MRYPASKGYCSYRYRADEHNIEFEFTGCAEKFDVQILLPPRRRIQKLMLDGHATETFQRNVEESPYLVLPPIKRGVHRIAIDLE